MNTAEILINWMEMMVEKFPSIHFKYEYSYKEEDHLICVYFENEFKNFNSYCKERLAFYEELDELFPDESILFCDNERLFSCSANALEIRHSALVESV